MIVSMPSGLMTMPPKRKRSNGCLRFFVIASRLIRRPASIIMHPMRSPRCGVSPRAMVSARPFSTASCADAALSTRSEEHTSELQSLMRISYAAFCLKKKTNNITQPHDYDPKSSETITTKTQDHHTYITHDDNSLDYPTSL